MTALWMAALLVSATPVEVSSPNAKPASSSSEAAASVPEKTPAQWRAAVGDALKKTASAKDAELDAAAELLLPLYQQLSADTKLPKADREQLRQQVRERLLSVRKDLVARIRKDQTAILAQKLPGAVVANNTSAVVTDQGQQLLDAVKSIQQDTWVERGGNGTAILFPGGAANGQAGAGGVAGAIGAGFGGGILAQQVGGAFGQGGAAGKGGNAQKPADHGQELVDLIQSIIAPQTWDTAGGSGSIRYWAPGGALIINQTGEVHDQNGDVLKQLRRAQ